MKREKQIQFKQLKTALPKIIRELASKYKLKKKDYILYGVKDELFLDCHIFISINDNEECICSIRENLKPLWLDELLWDLLDMSDNSKEPISLRAVGAFTVSGVNIFKKTTILEQWSEDQLMEIVEGYVVHFANNILEVKADDFIKNISQPYHQNVRTALYYIHNERYEDALDIIKDEKDGIFKNGDIDINDAIIRFCQKHK